MATLITCVAFSGVFIALGIYFIGGFFRARQDSRKSADTWRKHDILSRADNMFVASICFFLLAVVPSIPFIAQYGSSMYLEESIPALVRTIEQQSALIADNPTLGSGMEGFEIKQEIQKNIKKLNDSIAQGKVRIRSVWWFFKPSPVWEEYETK